jgi:mannose-6-phosphate isomerase-like protein (cupin superfamily)
MILSTIDIGMLLHSAKKVDKDWGTEWWISNTELYCAKILKLNAGYQCSLHCHRVKDEEFHVIEGHVRLEREDFVHYLSSGESLRISPGSYHRFSTTEGALILEVSTFHDDADVQRKEISRPI